MDQAYTNLGYGLKTFGSLNREKKERVREIDRDKTNDEAKK